MKRIFTVLLLAIFTVGITSCEDYFGEKTDLDFIEIPEFTNREVAYVPILPVLDQFDAPTDICIGFDELIYVVDSANEALVALDEAGREIGRAIIPGARSVTQDRRFDLLVIGTFDTTITTGGIASSLTFSAIYRVRLFDDTNYGINNARIINKIVHPFFEKNSFSANDRIVTFNRIGIIGNDVTPANNNRYYVSRSGPGSSAFGPNDAVFLFDNEDNLVTRVSVTTSSGLFNDYFKTPHGLSTLTQPPQFTASNSSDFIYASLDQSNALQVQYIEFSEAEFGAEWRPQIFASGDTSQADGFLNSPNKFIQPYDVSVAGDASQYIFVIDAAKDSVYQFTGTGLEGVLPPAATGITKYQKASFGGSGTGVTEFNHPQAVAYYNNILYVADTKNGRVLRFKLTLDFD